MVGRPGVIVAGRRGGGWGMDVVARVVEVRMPIPSALPGVRRVDLSVVDREVVVRVPADSQGCVVDGRWVVRGGTDEFITEFTGRGPSKL